MVADEDDLQRVLQHVEETDWFEYVRQQKPNRKWRIALLTNMAFHVYPLIDQPIGYGEKSKLPKWLIKNRGVAALEEDKQASKFYVDNLCYFLCLAKPLGCILKKLGKKDQRIGLYLLGYAGESREFQRCAFERFACFG